MYSLQVRDINISFDHPHDIAAILEVIVFDVYAVRNLKRGDIILDLGAGIGEYSILASKIIGPEGLVVAIEPNPLDYNILCENIFKNNVKNVLPLKYAIGKSDKIEIQFKDQKFLADTISPERLKEILFQRNLDHFNVIKMDIEGAETFALSLLSEFLNKVRFIPIELHGTKEEVDKILEPFVGFKFQRIKRNEYIQKAIKFTILHPIQTYKLWNIFKTTKDNPGFKKILKGIEISKSKDLMVGVYKRKTRYFL